VKSANLSREQLESWLRDTLLELEAGLSSEQIVGAASLRLDLGLDSLAFERLLGAIEKVLPQRDLTEWYADTAESGDDTLAGLVDFLLGEPRALATELSS
jgi:hypothetical protein